MLPERCGASLPGALQGIRQICELASFNGLIDIIRVTGQLLPQPPPDALAPPPGVDAKRSRRKMDWIIRIGIFSILGLFFWASNPMPHHGGKSAVVREAVNNAWQIGIALSEFEKVYGKRPESSTISEVRKMTGSKLTLSDRTSNDLFTQLLAADIIQTEQIFYAKSKKMRKADNVWNSDATSLAHGECAFAYIAGVTKDDDPATPIAFGPVIPGTRDLDLKALGNKGVVLRNDNSVNVLPLDASGKIRDYGVRMSILDPRQTYWKGKTPDVKWPK